MIWTRFRRQPSDQSGEGRGSPSRQETIASLYGMIVAQARSPAFYRDFGVPDTVNGRFDMIVLHLALVLGRLRGSGADTEPLAQGLFDHFCRDMDGNLREMGISDLKVPKQMKGIGEAVYGRLRAYDEALAAPGLDTLEKLVIRNLQDDHLRDIAPGKTPEQTRAGQPVAARAVAAYVRMSHDALRGQDPGRWEADGISFADPTHAVSAEVR
ncbi:MAG: ubiquinol-cytochrome C chaperone family protein [Pseudolabrys sp.]